MCIRDRYMGKKLLVGTYGAEIYELSTKDAKISEDTKFAVKELMKGHYTPQQKWTNEVWGLDVFKDGDRFASCSDDATLRIWSLSQRKILKWKNLNVDQNEKELPKDSKTGDYQDQAKARAIGLDQNNDYIAVGCLEGTVRVIDVNTLKHVKLLKNRKEWISDIKFAPDNSKMAVGSHDNFIDIYSVPDFKILYKLKGHSSYITHLDWSVDSSALQSNCGAYEILYWDATTGQRNPSGASAYRDEKWCTWSCVLGWPVQGIWPAAVDGTDINATYRSNKKHPGDYHLISVGDDFGKVSIYRYPSLKKGSVPVVGVGHSSHVTNVKFNKSDDMLISTGGEDNCVFQWKVEYK
eukprot:TRINITY_DN1486_c0_g1_i2.p1 TRINITY_DN1486_c0_g1~~TRINITY_DN1486_c0_g1_i2.p1  ORF type:complete len:351 (+),score=77.49 TRINITY_DN1486_c0_g1_i2:65-1117(+)